jgi:PIN domain nuclease of toxin-antitoxin system
MEVVADTHAILWFLEDDRRLSLAACAAMENARQILLPSISLVEITYLIEKRRLLQELLPRLIAELTNPSSTLTLAPLDIGVAQAIKHIPRDSVPDLPDRIIAATAFHFQSPLVTRDAKIRQCGIETIW